MRNFLKKKYIPFGSQYYRAPSPQKKDWEKDLKKMSDFGFNTVKFWVQWRWNNPEEGVYYFDDIDQLMELAAKNKLKVMLNTIFDTAPAWIYEKFPDASMVTLSGKKVGPQTQPHRQIGGLGYCFNHDGISEYFFEFLKQTVKKYKDHPALEIWNVGSEPELTSSMAEMRSYAEDASKIDDMLCYCNNCEMKFKIWLQQKYNSIKKLNKGWNRNYKNFEEVELPKTRNTFNDVIDWRMFFVHTIGENVKRRFEVAKKEDKGKHLLMCHHVFIQGFPVTSTANDPWNVGRFGDIHGFTQMDDAAMIDILRSCAKNKPVISAEMLMLPGYTLDISKPINSDDIKKFVFSGIAGNLKGFIFWQYRPEILGREAPAWGLTFLNGEETPWLKSFSEVGKVLQKKSEFILNAKRKKSQVAILYNPENQIFAWASTGNEKNATDSLLGFHRALYERNFLIDFIHPIEFDSEILKNYKVLILPFPYVINKKISKKIISWVKNGGILICESYTAGWNIEDGHHEKVIPGYDLHKIFKIKQSVVSPFIENKINIFLKKDIPYLKRNENIEGSIVKESFFVDGAEILASFDSGEPAITLSKFGKGKAIQIGSYVALPFHRTNNLNNGNFLAGIVEQVLKIEKPVISNNKKVRVDVLSDKKKKFVIIRNLEKENVNIEITLPNESIKKMTEQFSKEEIICENKKNDVIFNLSLYPGEVKVYCN